MERKENMNVDVIRRAADVPPEELNLEYWICGEVACLVGNCLIQSGMSASKIKALVMERSPEPEACRLMGISAEQGMRLFHVKDWPEEFIAFNGDGDAIGVCGANLTLLRPGTPEYSARVKQRVEHFIATEGRE